MNFDYMLKMKLVAALIEMPFISTEQAGRLFPHLKWGQKEASKYLKELEREKLVEGYDRKIGESKIWRLTLKGRKECDVKKRAVPFTVRNMAHYIAVGDCYFDLWEMGGTWMESELREEYINRLEKQRKYCPDGFFLYQDEPYFLEVQRSYLSRVNWSHKWKVANEFFGEKHHLSCSQAKYMQEKSMIPIVVVTDQKEEVVKTGAGVPLIVVKDFKELKGIRGNE